MAYLIQQLQQGLTHLTMLSAQLRGVATRQEPTIQMHQTQTRRCISMQNPG